MLDDHTIVYLGLGDVRTRFTTSALTMMRSLSCQLVLLVLDLRLCKFSP